MCLYSSSVCMCTNVHTYKHLLFTVFCKLLMVGVSIVVVVCVCMCAGQLSDNAILNFEIKLTNQNLFGNLIQTDQSKMLKPGLPQI